MIKAGWGMPQLTQSNCNFVTPLYFVLYLTNYGRIFKCSHQHILGYFATNVISLDI